MDLKVVPAVEDSQPPAAPCQPASSNTSHLFVQAATPGSSSELPVTQHKLPGQLKQILTQLSQKPVLVGNKLTTVKVPENLERVQLIVKVPKSAPQGPIQLHIAPHSKPVTGGSSRCLVQVSRQYLDQVTTALTAPGDEATAAAAPLLLRDILTNKRIRLGPALPSHQPHTLASQASHSQSHTVTSKPHTLTSQGHPSKPHTVTSHGHHQMVISQGSHSQHHTVTSEPQPVTSHGNHGNLLLSLLAAPVPAVTQPSASSQTPNHAYLSNLFKL